MTDTSSQSNSGTEIAAAAILALLVLTLVMLTALYTETPPHPPRTIPLFALAPFFGASLAIGAAAYHQLRRNAPGAAPLALIFAVTALLSFGPQKYVDPAFPEIWPAVVAAQLAIAMLVFGLLHRRAQR